MQMDGEEEDEEVEEVAVEEVQASPPPPPAKEFVGKKGCHSLNASFHVVLGSFPRVLNVAEVMALPAGRAATRGGKGESPVPPPPVEEAVRPTGKSLGEEVRCPSFFHLKLGLWHFLSTPQSRGVLSKGLKAVLVLGVHDLFDSGYAIF